MAARAVHRGRRRQQLCSIEPACRRARTTVRGHPPASRCRLVRSRASQSAGHAWTAAVERGASTDAQGGARFRHHALARCDAVAMVWAGK